jgi:Domain of unknown function (DUF5076)
MTSACYWTANCLRKDRPRIHRGEEETLCVHDGSEHGLVVEISNIVEHPKSWGTYLADIGRIISGALAEHNDMTRDGAWAEICKGFNSGYTFLPPEEELTDQQVGLN